MLDLGKLLTRMPALRASDLHVKAGVAPRYRVDGALVEAPAARPLAPRDLRGILTRLLDDDQERRFHDESVLHFSFDGDQQLRFRASYYHDHSGPAASFRLIQPEIPTLRELGLPATLESFAHCSRGLVLVTGAAGSGRSTTLDWLLDRVNREYRKVIVTLEDPIERRHQPRKSMVLQRGLGYDIHDFASGVRAAIAQHPDVLLVGELTDADTIRGALAAAEAGILVYSSLPTLGAAETIQHLVGAFPVDQQAPIRAMLAQALAGVVSQVLLPDATGEGRVPATEILVANHTVAGMIREGKAAEVTSAIQAGRGKGMVTLDGSLEELVQKSRVLPEDAWVHARNKGRIEPYLPRHGRSPREVNENDWVNQFTELGPAVEALPDPRERRNLSERD